MKRFPGVALLFFFIAVACGAGEAPPPAKKKSPAEILAPAQRYFNSGFYRQADKIFREFLKTYPTSPMQHLALYYRGRCALELSGNDTEGLKAAIQFLQQSRKGSKDKDLSLAALYWLGRAHYRHGILLAGETKKLRKAARDEKYAAAAKVFDRALEAFDKFNSSEVAGDIGFEGGYYRALSLAHKVECIDPDVLSPHLYETALAGFERLALQYEKRPEARYQQIVYLVRARRYIDALDVIAVFIRDYPDSPLVPEARFYRGECHYYSGQLNDAAESYARAAKAVEEKLEHRAAVPAGMENARPYPAIHIAAVYGRAWSYARLAATGEAQTRRRHYIHAAAAFRSVLDEMEEDDPRYRVALFKRAEALVELGENQDAFAVLSTLQQAGDNPPRITLMTGKAAAGAGRPMVAQQYFRHAMAMAEKARDLEILLNAGLSLARIELEHGNAANALQHYANVACLSSKRRNETAYAQSLLGIGTCLVDLSSPGDKMKRDSSGELPRAARALLAGSADTPLSTMISYNRLARALRSQEIRGQSGKSGYEDALKIFELLRVNHAERVRLDELYYQQARALAARARIKAAEFDDVLAPGQSSYDVANLKDPNRDLRNVLGCFQDSHDQFEKALIANPHGAFAGRIYYELGRVLQDAALFAHGAAVFYDLRKKADQEQIYQELAVKTFKESLVPFQRAVAVEGRGELAHNAQYRLASVYVSLGQDTPAETSFRILLNEPQMSPALRWRTALSLARTLQRLGRLQEAIDILQPYQDLHRSLPIQAGKIYEEMDYPLSAYRAYLLVKLFDPPRNTAERKLHAEALYRAGKVGIVYATRRPRPRDADKVLPESVALLTELPRRYADTEWGAPAVIALCGYLRNVGRVDEAHAVAERNLPNLRGTGGEQELYLLLADLLRDRKKYDEAIRYYRSAEVFAGGTRQSRARALLGLARAQVAAGRVEAGIGSYASVFANYPEQLTLADEARFEVAELLYQRGGMADAVRTLEGATDKARALARIRRYRKIDDVPVAEERDAPERDNE